MRFYTKQHPLYCGIDVDARIMYRWLQALISCQ